jgi:hypothetical protein
MVELRMKLQEVYIVLEHEEYVGEHIRAVFNKWEDAVKHVQDYQDDIKETLKWYTQKPKPYKQEKLVFVTKDTSKKYGHCLGITVYEVK